MIGLVSHHISEPNVRFETLAVSGENYAEIDLAECGSDVQWAFDGAGARAWNAARVATAGFPLYRQRRPNDSRFRQAEVSATSQAAEGRAERRLDSLGRHRIWAILHLRRRHSVADDS